jgi:hypothetical protein
MDQIANRVVEKYQNSCDQLAEKGPAAFHRGSRGHSAFARRSKMRGLIDRVAAPIANKIFECGMIP